MVGCEGGDRSGKAEAWLEGFGGVATMMGKRESAGWWSSGSLGAGMTSFVVFLGGVGGGGVVVDGIAFPAVVLRAAAEEGTSANWGAAEFCPGDDFIFAATGAGLRGAVVELP